MAYSMTGFGRGEKIYDTRKYSIEIKSVNSRFCDISIRMPRMFNYLDTDVRRIITDRLLRGKIDVFINYEDQGESGQTVTVNTGLAKEYSEDESTKDDGGNLGRVNYNKLGSNYDELVNAAFPMKEMTVATVAICSGVIVYLTSGLLYTNKLF